MSTFCLKNIHAVALLLLSRLIIWIAKLKRGGTQRNKPSGAGTVRVDAVADKNQMDLKGMTEKGVGALNYISSLAHIFTLNICKHGTTSQCFCALSSGSIVGPEAADSQCWGEFY
ncbi:hypothetical protein DUQ00_23705 [Salmonella bongori]|nr:hypothetical protein [Salmonella bongori]ECC9599200.1 hypothetical protein [Salmonella bongori]ECG8261342.1 hypothetical protein [Salmonella bongori serovar 48:i:-]